MCGPGKKCNISEDLKRCTVEGNVIIMRKDIMKEWRERNKIRKVVWKRHGKKIRKSAIS